MDKPTKNATTKTTRPLVGIVALTFLSGTVQILVPMGTRSHFVLTLKTPPPKKKKKKPLNWLGALMKELFPYGLFWSRSLSQTLKVCLFGGKIEWIENFGENILEGVWLGGERRKSCGGAWVFSPRTHKNVFSLKWGENWERECNLLYGQKCFQLLSWATLIYLFIYLFIFIYFFFFWEICLSLLFWFPRAWGDSDLFCFCSFFFFLLDVIFFSRHDYYYF